MSTENAALADEVFLDIMQAAKTVFQFLGAGHRENVYQKAMYVELSRNKSYTVSEEVVIPIRYRKTIVGHCRADIVVHHHAQPPDYIIECKIGRSFCEKTWRPQLLKYLENWNRVTGSGAQSAHGVIVMFPTTLQSDVEMMEVRPVSTGIHPPRQSLPQ